MKGLLLVARREIAERWTVLAAALVAGLLAFVGPLLPGVFSAHAAEARDMMALAFAVGFGLLVALMAGASVVARDLGEGRLGFDFARPLGGVAIWGGRFLAALALAGLAALLAFLPATAAGGGLLWLAFGARSVAIGVGLTLVGGTLILVPLGHAAAVALRARSRWLVLDLGAIVVALGLAASAADRLADALAAWTLLALQIALAAVALAALWAASAFQVLAGRSDLQRGHRLQALVLGPSLVLAALAAEGFSRWFVAVDPSDLAWAREAVAAPRGDWVMLAGPARGRPPDFQPAFLLDVRSGADIGLSPHAGFWIRFSADGARAAWPRLARSGDHRSEIALAELDASPPRVRELPLVVVDQLFRGLALSADGSRLAILEGQRLAVHETDTGRLLAVDEVADRPGVRQACAIGFRTDDAVRVYAKGERLEIGELDVATRRLAWIATVERNARSLAWTADHDRLLHGGLGGAALLDGFTGAVLASFAGSSAQLLADGRVAVIDKEHDVRRLRVFSRDGVEERSRDLDRRFVLGQEVAPGVLLAASGARGPEPGAPHWWSGWTLALVDLDRAAVDELGAGLPVLSDWSRDSGPRPEPGSAGTRLVHLTDGLGLYDPATREVAPLPAGRER
jgi:hypothetical protein